MSKPTKPPTGRAAAYAFLLPSLVTVARQCGYALGVHGSMQRDLDLIAVPWVAEAAEPEALVEALRESVGGYLSEHDNNGDPYIKPHGRVCWAIHFGGGMYLDISIMARTGWYNDEMEAAA